MQTHRSTGVLDLTPRSPASPVEIFVPEAHDTYVRLVSQFEFNDIEKARAFIVAGIPQQEF